MLLRGHAEFVRVVGERGEELPRSLEDLRHLNGLVLALHGIDQETPRGCAQCLSLPLSKVGQGGGARIEDLLQRVPFAGLLDLGADVRDLVRQIRQLPGQRREVALLLFELRSIALHEVGLAG